MQADSAEFKRAVDGLLELMVLSFHSQRRWSGLSYAPEYTRGGKV
jgi:hypothetical protein